MPIKRNDGMNAVQRYQSKCDCITIRPLADVGAAIRSAASAEGISTTQYILKAIAFYENHKEKNNMNGNQIKSMREKVMKTEQKVYNTKVYQYWINGNGELCRAKRDELDTVECKVEVLG